MPNPTTKKRMAAGRRRIVDLYQFLVRKAPSAVKRRPCPVAPPFGPGRNSTSGVSSVTSCSAASATACTVCDARFFELRTMKDTRSLGTAISRTAATNATAIPKAGDHATVNHRVQTFKTKPGATTGASAAAAGTAQCR